MNHHDLVLVAILLIALAVLSGLVLVLRRRSPDELEIGGAVMDNAMEPRRSPAPFLILVVMAAVASWAAWGPRAAPPPTPTAAAAPAVRTPGSRFHLPSLPSFPSSWFRRRPRPPKRAKPPEATAAAPAPVPETPPAPEPPPPSTGKPV